MEYIEAEIDEIFPDSVLRFYDPRRTENSTLFWVKPSTSFCRAYTIFQEVNTPEGKFLNPVKQLRDQVDCIRVIVRFFADNPLGIEAKMQIL